MDMRYQPLIKRMHNEPQFDRTEVEDWAMYNEIDRTNHTIWTPQTTKWANHYCAYLKKVAVKKMFPSANKWFFVLVLSL